LNNLLLKCTFRAKLLCSGETIHHIFIFLGRGQDPPHFVVKVVTGVDGRKCDWQHLMAHLRKPPHRRKNLAKISYASRVIVNFVPTFVAMATGVSRGKMQLAAFYDTSPKTTL